MRLITILLVGVTLQLPGCAERTSQPRNIIFFISDGCGPASFTMAREYVQSLGGTQLATDQMLVGSARTFSSGGLITDSAASGTAYSCGIKTYNGAIAMDTTRRPVATLLEGAEERGMATGLVATSTITHATPAAFSAHVANRADQAGIALQQMEQGIEVLLGGGAGYYLPADQDGHRTDGRNLLAEAAANGSQVVRSRDELMAVRSSPVLGLFAADHMSYEIDRDEDHQPSLAEMTLRAIELLEDDPDGFFLMVEGSRIDHAAHGNDAAAHLRDILAFDEAIQVGLEFARKNGETLIVSTSDHETGGMSVGARVDGVSKYSWKPGQLTKVQHSLEYAADSLLGRETWSTILEMYGIDDPTEDEVRMGTNGSWSRQALADMRSKRAQIGWTTGGHTGVDVNVYAFGPGSDLFQGHHDNTRIGIQLARLMNVDLAALTTTLRAGTGAASPAPSGG
jgi:alkaline phosphatase